MYIVVLYVYPKRISFLASRKINLMSYVLVLYIMENEDHVCTKSSNIFVCQSTFVPRVFSTFSGYKFISNLHNSLVVIS